MGHMSDPLPRLRRVIRIEAISYLALLGVGMPIHYGLHQRWSSWVFGMVHGLLFLLLIWMLVRARFERDWPAARLWRIFWISWVPFWPLRLDREMAAWIAATPPR